MDSDRAELQEPGRSSRKRLERLADLLNEIETRQEADPELLQRFKTQYGEVPRDERPWFFDMILRRMEVRKRDIVEDLRALAEAREEDSVAWTRALTGLRRKIESPRVRAFQQFLDVPGGFKFLLDLRADLLAAQRLNSPDLEPVDEEISQLFNAWFQHGFLFLQEITQDSPFRQIHFLKEHDMVHPMASLEEMGSRLGEDRRCFALYHRAMSEEPVIFIEAALTRDIARSIHEILREGDDMGKKGTPDTAVFYSINNTQNGLAGLGLGKVLVFQVVEAIKKNNPGIKTFASLSPVPGFWRHYLKPILEGEGQSFALTKERLLAYFPDKVRQGLVAHAEPPEGTGDRDFASVLTGILSRPDWIEDQECAKWLERPLTDATYFYITSEKNRQGKPLNPVANFHMSNGARVSYNDINFGANRSERGLADSCGMMVNYVYSMTWYRQIGKTVQSLLPWKS